MRCSSLDGRVALVTGAAGGLGKAIVTQLRERSAEVHGVNIAAEDILRVDLSAADGNRQIVSHVVETAGQSISSYRTLVLSSCSPPSVSRCRMESALVRDVGRTLLR